MSKRFITHTLASVAQVLSLAIVSLVAATACAQEEPLDQGAGATSPKAAELLAEIEKEGFYSHAGKHAEAVREMSEEDQAKFYQMTMKWASLDYRSQSSREMRIESTLDDETEMEFIETPLQDVVEYVSDLHGIPVLIDESALEEVGITTDAPITFQSRSATLKSSLTNMLQPMKLDLLVGNDVLKITSQKQAAEKMQICVYETRRLKHITTDMLSEVIRSSVDPGGWRPDASPADEKRRATITAIPGGLVITQSWRNHEQVVDVLRQLMNHQTNPLFDPAEDHSGARLK